jgi:hypothetical protein
MGRENQCKRLAARMLGKASEFNVAVITRPHAENWARTGQKSAASLALRAASPEKLFWSVIRCRPSITELP